MNLMTKFGVSLCTGSTERFEPFSTRKGEFLQYDYRHSDGELFSCVKPSIQECRDQRDKWLVKKPIIAENEVSLIEASELFMNGESILAVEQGGMGLKTIMYLSKAEYHFRNEDEPICLSKAMKVIGYRRYKLYKI